jgi:outer membrane protein assembly factor BamB
MGKRHLPPLSRSLPPLLGLALVLGAAALMLAAGPPSAPPLVLVRHVSREDPLLNVQAARLSVGRDGRVYLWSDKYVLRVERDGSGKLGSEVTYALTAATANARGVVATGNAHFSHSVNFWSPKFERLGAVSDFLNNDQVEYFAPGDVQAGASGDFYGLDQNRTRILRVAAPDRLVTAYSLSHLGEDLTRRMARFRVWEQGRRFYVLCPSGTLRVVGFDGKPLWSLKPGVGGDPWSGWRGGLDVDGAGRLLVLQDAADVVKVFGPDGKPAGELRLQMGKRKGRVSDLQVFGDDILVRRPDPVELFQVYNRATGALRRVVRADVDRVTVSLPSGPWTAGDRVPVAVAVESEGRVVRPDWRVWLRPPGTPDFLELPLRDGAVTVPADAGGFHQLRVSPGRGGAADELSVETVIEVRRDSARGSVSVFTPLNRLYYGQGERVPVSVVVRTIKGEALPDRVAVRLLDGARVLAEGVVRPTPGKPAGLVLPASLTAALRPGRYLLTAEAPHLTAAPQSLVIGPGLRRPPAFRIVGHGDYHDAFPKGGLLDAPEQVAAHLERSRKLGVNLFVDRLGSPIGPLGAIGQTLTLPGLADRAKTGPLSAAPEKATFEGPLRQTVAGYGAFGIEEQAILLNMDAGLPVGTGFDARKPEQFADAIAKVTTGLAAYPAFRGWSWAANWWLGKLGAEAAATPEEKKAYQAALQRARKTGAWDPVLDRVSDAMVHHAVAAEQQFRAVLRKVGPGKVSAMTGPYRAVGVVPPVTFRNADEVDLHYQAEQIQPPQATPHEVDFCKRPGKRAWGHPELWNDDGTGGMIYPTVLQMVMRGADGIGWSGNAPEWATGHGDARSGGRGTASVHRSLAGLLRGYGPWHVGTEKADRVALVVSSRMLRIDDWSKIGGWYFDRLFEAYNACLYAHRPASFVFAEDAGPDSLKAFAVVLVVAQRVELDPSLAAALKEARAAGVKMVHDSLCRAELVKDFTPLGIAFDSLLKEPSAWQDDSAYARFPRYFTAQAAVLKEVLGPAVAPVAACAEPGVMLSERRSHDARFVWAVNNVPTGLDPGLAWRVGLLISQRAPLVARLGLDAEGKAVYDVFALRRLKGSEVEADLRTMPARLYAILPAPLERVVVRGPATVKAGRAFAWEAKVLGPGGKPFRARLPIRARLLGHDGAVLAEEYTSTWGERSHATFVVPLNAPPRPASLEVVDLIAGKSARLEVPVTAAGRPVSLLPPDARPEESAPLPPDATAEGDRAGELPPAEKNFGPHFRSITASADGSTVLLGAFNWDQNLYALDAATGQVRWRGRVGHHFAYSPSSIKGGFAVEGFDLSSAEGYHLYRLSAGGRAERRYALYGLPKRATNWAAAANVTDAINHFAIAPDGSWAASSGDLGLAVWDRDGKLLWSIDWWKTERKRVPVAALDRDTLLALDGTTAAAYRAVSGEKVWALAPAKSGTLRVGAVSADRHTVALLGSGEGGRVFLLRGGKLVGAIPVLADAVALSPDGSAVVTTAGRQLRWYSAEGSLAWDFTAADVLRGPAVSPDGKRVCAGSEIGTLYVLDHRGEQLAAADLGALPTAAWLTDAGLVAATWGGTVIRYDASLKERWRSLPRPTVTDARPNLLAAEVTPTTRRQGWGNAAEKPAALTPNLLRETKALITAVSDPPAHGDPRPWENKVELLTDGKPDAPPRPWLSWSDVNMIDSGWRARLALQVDTFRTQLRVTGVTFVEDPAHPESWLRDVRLQWWDAAADRWRDGPSLLSDAATHTHRFEKPIEAARFRLVTTGGGTWPAGNLRLGELVFHGEALGASHPDAAAKRPVAVLFDEREDDLSCLKLPGQRFTFQPTGAYSGGKCLALAGEGMVAPHWRPPFGHAVPNWDFEIAESPAPGQYRYLQFAWKASSSKTTGMSLLVGRPWPGGGVAVTAGKSPWKEGVIAAKQAADRPPADWQVVRVDLWALAKKPLRIQSIGLAASGGGALFDQVLLGRSEAELGRVGRLPAGR